MDSNGNSITANVNFTTNTVTANGTTIYFMGPGTLNIGSYSTVSMNNSSVYITNGDFNASNGTYIANNITIYIKQGNFYLQNGLYGVTMSSPGCSTLDCHVPPSTEGVLVNLDKNYSHTFTITNGNGPHSLKGTIYAPTSLVELSGGTSTATDDVQIIAKQINVSGGAILNMNLSDATLYSQGSTVIELQK